MGSQKVRLQGIAASAGIGGGGGNVPFANYINGSINITDISAVNSWVDAGSINFSGTIDAGKEFIVYLQTLLGLYSLSPNLCCGGIRIIDHNGNLIDECVVHTAGYINNNAVVFTCVNLKGRYTFASQVDNPVFKVQIRNLVSGTTTSVGYSDWTGALDGPEGGNLLYATPNN